MLRQSNTCLLAETQKIARVQREQGFHPTIRSHARIADTHEAENQ